MRRYEMMFLMNAALPEDDRYDTIDRVEETIEELGGRVVRSADYDVREMAYEIDNATRAHYRVMRFELGEHTVQELKDRLGLMDEMLRFLLVRLEEEDKAFTASREESEVEENGEAPEPVDEGGGEEPASGEADQDGDDDEEAAAGETEEDEDGDDDEEPAAGETEEDEDEEDDEEAAAEETEEESDEADGEQEPEDTDEPSEDEAQEEAEASDEADEEAEEEEEPAEAT